MDVSFTSPERTERYQRDNFELQLQLANSAFGAPKLPEQAIEDLYSVGDQQSRHYHDTKHFMDVAASFSRALFDHAQTSGYGGAETFQMEQMLRLAGFRHDAAYPVVDGGLQDAVGANLSQFVEMGDDKKLRLKADLPEDKRLMVEAIAEVFGGAETGFVPGQALPGRGTAEFLSAVYGADTSGLELKYQVAQSALIAATVPFGPADEFAKLEERFAKANAMLPEGGQLSERDIQRYTLAAVQMANVDVIGFSGGGLEEKSPEDRLRFFAQGTWKLIPEMNAKYRPENEVAPVTDYTASDYRATMAGNRTFLTGDASFSLNWDNVYHQYDNGSGPYPSDADFARLKGNAAEVKAMATEYFDAKLASIAVVEALAREAGLAGESLPSLAAGSEKNLSVVQRIGPKVQMPQAELNDRSDAVLAVLENRGDAPGFDVAGSPLGAFVMKAVGPEGAKKLADSAARNFTKDVQNSEAFLADAREVLGNAFGVVQETIARNVGENIGRAAAEAVRRVGNSGTGKADDLAIRDEGGAPEAGERKTGWAAREAEKDARRRSGGMGGPGGAG